MSPASSLLLMAGVYLAVLASPGPNFFILSQLALDGHRREARQVAYGITTGSVFWVLVSVAGVATLLAQHPWVASGVRMVGAAYLVWYGSRLLRSAFAPAGPRTGSASGISQGPGHAHGWTAYRTGLLTGITNPKAAAFWTSAFAAVFPSHAPAWLYIATVLLVALMSMGWHVGISVVFGIPALRAGYLRIERAVNGVAGGVLVALGLQRLLAR